ncbi:MAG: hypothetical protein ACE5O2_13415 [Armatimonadota bacterium]
MTAIAAGLICLVVILSCASGAPAAGEPLRLDEGPHLFVDDHLIAHQRDLTRTINQPERLREPVVTGPQDKCFQPYVTDEGETQFYCMAGIIARGHLRTGM